MIFFHRPKHAVLSLICFGSFAAIALLWFVAVGRAAERPNVLIICADDHAPYVCGAYGNQQVHTPNIDRLAAEGMRFDRAYCNSPVCTASRQSFLTGRYPRTIGVTQLKTALPEGEVTLAELLSAAGYHTRALGKMHFNSRLLHGFEQHVDVAAHRAFLRRNGGAKPIPADVAVLGKWRPFRDPAEVWLNGFYRPYAAVDEDMLSTFLAHRAEEYLKSAAGDAPFFMIVSFREPHSPFHFPIEFRGRHNPRSFPVAKIGPEDDWQIPAIFRHLTDEQKQGIVAAYYTSVEFLDENVGRVMDALRKSGHAEDTLVIYLGDHGYMLGQHGRFEKHCMYEPAVRSPLIFRDASRISPGSSTDALVEFVDLVPTVLERCGVEVPHSVQGRSLLPLLTGQTNHHRDQVVVEYSENEEAMIRTKRWKLIYTTGNRQRNDGYKTDLPLPPQQKVRLYDVENDPAEMHNVAGNPRHARRVADLLKRLADHMVRTARQPEFVPKKTADVFVLLDHCLKPRDVGSAKR